MCEIFNDGLLDLAAKFALLTNWGFFLPSQGAPQRNQKVVTTGTRMQTLYSTGCNMAFLVSDGH